MRAARLVAVVALACLAGAPARAQSPASGDGTGGPTILHIPLLERRAEQGILRPVPLAVELPREVALSARRVLVHYRLWGDPDWTTLELRRQGKRFEGAIPCREVSTVTGDLKYYIRVHDAGGRVIATGASRAAPYRVTIRHDTTLRAEQKKVAKCPDPADCPAGLPGCPSARVVEIACDSDADCEGGATCSWRGSCERVDRRTSWISASGQQDIGVIATAGACSLHMQENQGYGCWRSDGSQYAGNPVLTNEPLAVGAGPTRVVIGFDQLVGYDTSIGVRAGWAVRGEAPTARAGTGFVPISFAVRATHWFGEDPFVRSRLRPFAFVTAGYAMTDVSATTRVREDPTAPSYQGGNDLEQTLDLYKRAGDGFVGLGGGMSVAIGTGFAAHAELSIVQAFPFGALVISPAAGVSLGF